MRIHAALLATTMICSLAQPAFAKQDATDDDQTAQSGEIIVTAQRRSERLVDVPISITALSGNTLESTGVRSAEDLTAVVPGLNFVSFGAFAQPTVRGIGTTVTGAGSDANVAIYVDGVYQPNQVANFTDLVDLEQIEVLKGPQGTLFGRNATGGAMRITTKRPSWTPEARMTASYGRFKDIRLSAFGTSPLSDQLAASFSFLYGDDAGYARNVGTGNRVADANVVSIRGKLLFKPSDSFELLLAGGHIDKRTNPAFTLGVLNGNNTFLRRVGSIPANGPREVSLSFDPYIDVSNDNLSLTAKGDLGFAELTSITSYSNTKTYLLTDVDRTNLALSRADIPGRQKTWTQEVNLVSKDAGLLNWFLGAYYYKDDATTATILNNGSLFTQPRMKAEAFAPFGEINIKLGAIKLIAGLRYNIETKDFVATRGTLSIPAKRTYRNLTPRVGVQFKPSNASTLYATYSRGFKSGTYDAVLFNGNLVVNTVTPETLDSYEVGFKYGSGRTSLSTSAFYYDYKNIQFNIFNPNAGGLSQIFNAAAAEVYGAEAEASISPLDGLTLRASGTYTHSKYKSFPTAAILCPIGAPNYGNATIALGALNPCTGKINSAGATGNRMIRTPEWTASLAAEYKHKLGNGGGVELSANLFYTSDFYWDAANRLRQAPYALVNGEIGYTFPGDQFKIALWGRNLTDKLYALYAPDSASGDSVAYARPRTYGVRAELRF